MEKMSNRVGEIKQSTQEFGVKINDSIGKYFDSDKRISEKASNPISGNLKLAEKIIAKAEGYSEPAISLANNLAELKNGDFYSKDIQRDTAAPPRQLELLKSQKLKEGMVGEVRALKAPEIDTPEFLNKESLHKVDGEYKTVTNFELMKQGKAPIGEDGKPCCLHHNSQEMTSSLSELTDSFHKANYGDLHSNPGIMPSKINRIEFAKQRAEYWKNRAEEIESKGI